MPPSGKRASVVANLIAAGSEVFRASASASAWALVVGFRRIWTVSGMNTHAGSIQARATALLDGPASRLLGCPAGLGRDTWRTMSEENVEAVRALYEAFERGDSEAPFHSY